MRSTSFRACEWGDYPTSLKTNGPSSFTFAGSRHGLSTPFRKAGPGQISCSFHRSSSTNPRCFPTLLQTNGISSSTSQTRNWCGIGSGQQWKLSSWDRGSTTVGDPLTWNSEHSSNQNHTLRASSTTTTMSGLNSSKRFSHIITASARRWERFCHSFTSSDASWSSDDLVANNEPTGEKVPVPTSHKR